MQQQQQQWQLEQTRRGYQAQQDAYAAAAQQQMPSPRPTREWIKTWGAIAVNDKGDGGVAVGKLKKKTDGRSCTEASLAAQDAVGGGIGHGNKGGVPTLGLAGKPMCTCDTGRVRGGVWI